MTTRSGVENTILYDPAKIDERFDLVPDQMIDYKALKGDPTDNIPGVPGVGEKTAAKLIREFGTLEALYERIDEVKPDKLRDKLVEHRDAVFMGKDLSTIVRDLPGRASTSRPPASATTTARRSSGSSASTSSGP